MKIKRIKKAIVVALIITSLVMIFDFFQEISSYEYRLSIVIKTSVDSVAQIFYDVGNNLNENDSAKKRVYRNEGFQKIEFKLPAESIRFLRFDPLNNEGKFVIKKAQVIYKNNIIKKDIELDKIVPINQIKRFEYIAKKNILIGETEKDANDPMLDMNVSYEMNFLGRFNNYYELNCKRTFRLFTVVFLLTFSAIIFAFSDFNMDDTDCTLQS